MKTTIIRIAFLLIVLGFYGCFNPYKDKTRYPKSVDYSVVSRSPFFNKKNTTLTIDTINNLLIVRLTLNAMRDLPYPINTKDKDTLTETAFNFDFYCNGSINSRG